MDICVALKRTVEPPAGDNLRNYPSTLAEECRLFLGTNRGKRSIVLDLKKAEGLEVLDGLLRDFDVFVHNFRPAWWSGWASVTTNCLSALRV